MRSEKKRIWAVICGAVRLEFELYGVIALLCEWRSQGSIEGIVLSTWRGEVDQVPGLRQKLQYLDISLLEAAPLDQSVEKYTNLNYIRQAIQLNNALNYVPEDVFVLKCRTDYCATLLNRISSFFEKDMTIRPFGSFVPCLKHKIAIIFTSVSSPFFSCDIVFFGHKADLRSMLIFENTMWGWGKVCNPDSLFFRNLFIHNYPVVSEFVKIVNSPPLNVIFRDKLGTVFCDNNFYLPGILNKFYALYFVLLYTCFELPEDGIARTKSLYTLFHKDNNKDWHVPLDCPLTLKKIVYGELEHSDGFEKLYREINKIGIIPGYMKSLEFTGDDYRETVIWGKKFDTPVGRWLSWPKTNKGTDNKINFENATRILFADYQLTDQTVGAIKKATSGNGNYYQKLVNQLDILEKSDKTLYEKALFTSARGQDGVVLERIGRMLYEGEVSDRLVDEATMVFERYKGKAVFYKNAAMSPEKLLGIYYYGKYATEKQKSDFAEASWRVLRVEWEISLEDSGIPTDYAEGLVELAKRKVESSYAEFAGNKLISILTEFLLRVETGQKLSQEYIIFLKEQGQGELADRILQKQEVAHER